MHHASTRSSSTPTIVMQRARSMRLALTASEQRLWLALRGGALGIWFRRQAALRRCIGDFVAVYSRMVVEVDGGYHARRREQMRAAIALCSGSAIACSGSPDAPTRVLGALRLRRGLPQRRARARPSACGGIEHARAGARCARQGKTNAARR
jgi:very-short-patch-repair endonuclease